MVRYRRMMWVVLCLSVALVLPAGEPSVGGEARSAAVGFDAEASLEIFTGTNPERPGRGESLSGSQVAFDGGAQGYDWCWSPGSPQTFCFEARSYTGDWEYVYNFWTLFPADWVVHNVHDIGPDACTGGTFGPFAWSHYGANPFEIDVDQTRSHQPTDECTTTICFDVTTGAGSGDAYVSWYWAGDGIGSVPHWPCSDDGYTPFGQQPCDEAVLPRAAIPECVPGLYLFPETLSVEGCNGLPQTHHLALWNNSGSDSNLAFTYSVVQGRGTLTGPASIFVLDGATVDLVLEVTPDPCMLPGERLEGTIEVVGNGYTDSAILDKLITSGGWSPVAASAPAWEGSGYPGDGCTAMNAAGQWVTYIIGDQSQIGGFWGYNHSINTWFDPSATGTPGDRWSPEWAYDSEANLCYLTGGATAPGPGNLSDAYLFDPVANAFTALPDFSTARNFHDSWVGRVDGAKLLCIGGGIDAGSAVLGSTQCYDLDSMPPGWSAENSVLGGYPQSRFGAADGTLHAPGGDQFWFSSGVDGTLATTDTAWYFDDADNGWHSAGGTGQPLFRSEGDFFAGSFYQVGGTQDLSTPTDAVYVHDGTGWAPFPGLNDPRLAPVVGATDTTLWSVDGFDGGSGPTDYVERLLVCPACPEADIMVTKIADPDPAVIGSPLVYIVTVTNLGPEVALNVTVTDTLPAETDYVSCTIVGGICIYDGSRHDVTAAGFNLDPLESIEARITVIPRVEGEITNFVEVSTGSSDPDMRNNTAEVTTAVGNLLTYYDDYGRSWVCINEYTWDWEWTAHDPRIGAFRLAGAGTGRWQSGILTVQALQGTPWTMNLKYFLTAQRAYGNLVYLAYRIRSSLYDLNTANDPPICGN